MNEQIEQLDRLTTAFGNVIRDQTRQMESGLRTLSGALDQAANRLAAVVPGAAPPVAGAPAAAAPAAALPAGAVRIVNDASTPIPVMVVNLPAAPQQQRRQGGFLGFLTSVFGAIGDIGGSLLGGLFGGLARPVISLIAGAELIVVAAQVGTLADKVLQMLLIVERILNTALAGIYGLMQFFFNQLTAAGIFPVSRLIASLLFLIDRGITLVLSHIEPLIDWAKSLLEYTIGWTGRFISAISTFLSHLLNTLVAFLAEYVDYLLEWIVKPAVFDLLHNVVRPIVGLLVKDAVRALVEAVGAVVLSTVFAMGNVLRETFIWGGQAIAYALVLALFPLLPGLAAPLKPGPLDLGKAAREGIGLGKFLGKEFAEAILGPAPAPGAAAPGEFPATIVGPRPEPPTVKLPGFGIPRFELPAVPTTGPLLERIMKAPEAPPAPGPGTPPVSVTGGLNVQVTAQTVDMDNADATARVIASHVLDELNRLVERDRFRRGLPTTTTA